MTEEEASRALASITEVAKETLKSVGKAADSMAKLVIPSASAATTRKTPSELKRDRDRIEGEMRNEKDPQRREEMRRRMEDIDSILRTGADQLINVFKNTTQQIAAISLRFSQGLDPFMDTLDATESIMSLGSDAIKGLGGAASAASEKVSNTLNNTFVKSLGLGGDAALAFGRILIEQYRNLVSSYRSITSSGIILADGLSGLGTLALESGFGNVQQFAKALESARPYIEHMGLAGGVAAKNIANTFRELRANGGELGQQLTALGYNVNEQAELTAIAMANNRAAGRANTNLTKDTLELGKSMKLLSELTGKNAKQLNEEARQASLRGRVVASLGPEQLKAYQGAMKGSMKVFSDAITESVSPFGDVITPELAFIVNSVPGFRTAITELKGMIESGADASAITAKRIEIEGRLQPAVQQFMRDNPFLAASNALQNVPGSVKTIADNLDTMSASMVARPEDIEGAQKRLADTVNRTDKLLNEYTKTTEAAITAQNEINAMMSKPMQAVAGGLESLAQVLSGGAAKISGIFDNLPGIEKYNRFPGGPNSRDAAGIEAQGREERIKEILEEERKRRNQKTNPQQPTPRAQGGPVLPNRTYLVGEQGPELLVSRETGTILNNLQVNQMSAANQAFEKIAAKLDTMISETSKKPDISQALERMLAKLDTATSGTEVRDFQNDMRQLMREQVMLLKTHVNATRDLGITMDNLESIQSRFATTSI